MNLTNHTRNGYSDGHNNEEKADDGDQFALTSIWVCSWNMAAKDHNFKFKTTADGQRVIDPDQIQKFEQIIPTNYDLYVFGVQEGVSDAFFHYIALYLRENGITRVRLLPTSAPSKTKKSSKQECFGVHGRGDGSFISTKFTGIAIYYRESLAPFIRVKQTSAVSAGITQGSKGAACVLLKVFATTIVFMSTHMSSNSTDQKLEHFKVLVNKAGDTLGCPGMDLLNQFHHVVWFGDLNYRIQTLTADQALSKMALGHLASLWEHDSLRQEWKRFAKSKRCAFRNFVEPTPRLDFYPTYKKKPNRQLDFDQNPKELQRMNASDKQSSLSQLDKIYTTKYKEPFYKGGSIHDRIPSFCDRLLYHSLDHHQRSRSEPSLWAEADTAVLNCVEFSYKKDGCHNYGSIPHQLMGSDHSAIYCGLKLRSSRLFPCSPHELCDNGSPKSYQLKVEDVRVIHKVYDSTSSETPIKTKICFPAPHEIENEQYAQYEPFAHTITMQDLAIYRQVQRQIEVESQRRVSQHRMLAEQKQTLTRNAQRRNKTTDKRLAKPKAPRMMLTPTISDKPPQTNSIMDELAQVSGGKKSVPLNTTRDDATITRRHSSLKPSNSQNDVMLNALEDISDMPSENAVEAGSLPALNALTTQSQKNTSVPKSAPATPQAADDSAGNGDDDLLRFFDETDRNESIPSKIEGSLSTRAAPSTTKTKARKRNNSGGIKDDNPIAKYLESSTDDEDDELPNDDEPMVQLPDFRELQKMISSPTTSFQLQQKQAVQVAAAASKAKTKPLNSSIRDDYFESVRESAPVINPMRIQRTRSKSMGSFQEFFSEENHAVVHGHKNRAEVLAPTSTDAAADHDFYPNNEEIIKPISKATKGKHQSAQSQLIESPQTIAQINKKVRERPLVSALYKNLAEMSKKLTFLTFGPTRRPTHGVLHCVVRVEINEYKGQCVITFDRHDFANDVEQTQFADLYHHGVPIYDKSGSPIRLKLHYKLSLIDKPITFVMNNQ